MTIYYLSTLTYPSTYANRIQVLKMASSFAQRSEVILYVRRSTESTKKLFSDNGIIRPFTIKTIESDGWLLRALFHAQKLKPYIKDAPKDTTFYIREIPLALWLILLSKRFRSSFFFEVHSLHRFPKVLYTYILRKASGVISTNHFKKETLSTWGILPERIVVEPNGFDAERFSQQYSVDELREKLNLPKGKKIVLYLGAFTKARGIETFLSSAGLASEHMFVAVGGSYDDTEALRRKYKGKNILIRSRVPYHVAPSYLQVADCIVAPWSKNDEMTERQGSPLRLTEFMASGTPLVASNVSAVRERAGKEEVVFVNPDDPKDIARAVKEVFSDEISAKRRAEIAQTKTRQYTWEERGRRILDFVERNRYTAKRT